MNFLEKPIEEYQRFNGYLNGNPQFIVRCLIWFPKSFEQEEPHIFILARDIAEYKFLEHYLNPKNDKEINLTAPLTRPGNPEPYGFHLFKNLYFSHASVTIYAENWEEGFFKYRWPKGAITTQKIEQFDQKENQVVKLFYTPSSLLESKVSMMQHYNGERERLFSHDIVVADLEHLGLESIKTDKFQNSNETFVLEVSPCKGANTLLGFHKRIKPIAQFTFAVVSFLERKKINWHQANFTGKENYYEIFNTRQTLNSAKNDYPLMEAHVFPEVFEEILRAATFENMQYKSELCLAYVSGIEYSINAKVILWNSLLEKILKHHNLVKKDSKKVEGIEKLHIPTSDIHSVKDLIDLRNDIVHGDDVDSARLFDLSRDWELLMERMILSELGYNNFYQTHLRIRNKK